MTKLIDQRRRQGLSRVTQSANSEERIQTNTEKKENAHNDERHSAGHGLHTLLLISGAKLSKC